MIERAALAIYVGRNGAGCRPWHSLPKSHREPYLKDARAALEAIREPTAAMLALGAAAYDESPEAAFSDSDEAMGAAHRAMIDAALRDAA